MGMISLETAFEDISITFSKEVWCFCLFIFACTIIFITKYNTTFTNWIITHLKIISRQPEGWYQVESASCDASVLIRICFIAKTGLDSWASIICAYENNSAGKYKKTKLSKSVKNLILDSAKTVLSEIIPVVNQRGNRLFMLAIKVAFCGLYFIFRVFLLISYLF